MKILFEPWNLGDAIIAASIANVAPEHILLACNSGWHEILNIISNGSIRLLPLDLPYVMRSQQGRFDMKIPPGLANALADIERRDIEVVSIRGDLRDWISAHRIFSGARFRFSGWFPYLARWIAVLDVPFRLGYLPVRNRYRAWAEAAGIPFGAIEQRNRQARPLPEDAPVLIHIGAQWRSKQYPHVVELTDLLRNAGNRVEILAGPNDPLPPGISADAVQKPGWPDLVQHLRNAGRVITNDSGPMHLAAFLGCRTLALSRCSNIREWLPPGAKAISSPSAPLGYRPVRDYWSDQILADWPAPDEVVAFLKSADD